jgi:hypothetical protein
MKDDRKRRRRNIAAVLASLGIVAAMVGLSYASVPLYRLYCQVTGYQGATRTALRAPDAASTATITVRLDANVNNTLPWSFTPEQPQVTMALGESVTAVYRVKNLSDKPTVGSAVRLGPVLQQDPVLLLHRACTEAGRERGAAGHFLRRSEDPRQSGHGRHRNHHTLLHFLPGGRRR